MGRAGEAGSCHLGGEIAVGAGDDGTGGESRPVGRGQPTCIGSRERLEDHNLGEQAGGDAAKCLRQIESTERKAVEHGEHRRRPPPGGLVLPDVGRQLAATEPFGRRPELLQLGRELEATHARTLMAVRSSQGGSGLQEWTHGTLACPACRAKVPPYAALRRIVTLPVVNDGDLAIRNLTYRLFVARGQAPTCAEVAEEADAAASEIAAAWKRLHDVHALVLDPATGELHMANPFSAAPTAYRVRAADRWWYANCAWDAFGICAALHVDGRIETACADCGELIACRVAASNPTTRLLFHCLVPAAGWWDDIVFT